MKETETIGLSSILKEKNIVVKEGFKNIKELIDFSLSLIYDDISDEVIKKIIEEKKEIMYSSPVFDNGLVIPHIRIDVLNFFSSLVVLKNPIILDEDKKIWICFTLISPLNKKFFEKHLKILSTVASVFKNPSEFISLTPSKIYSAIFQR
jgi:mannitol/fructose-specific phosphotransferase system IIA component (Ntr-type)